MRLGGCGYVVRPRSITDSTRPPAVQQMGDRVYLIGDPRRMSDAGSPASPATLGPPARVAARLCEMAAPLPHPDGDAFTRDAAREGSVVSRCPRGSRGRSSASRRPRPRGRLRPVAVAWRRRSPPPAPRRARSGISDLRCRGSPAWARRSRRVARAFDRRPGSSCDFAPPGAFEIATHEVSSRRFIEPAAAPREHPRVADLVLDHRPGVRPVHVCG